METKTKMSFVISIAAVLLAIGAFRFLQRFTPRKLKADIHSRPEPTVKDEVNLIDSSLNEELLETAGKGNMQAVQSLVSKGADVNARDERGETALLRATVMKNTEIVRLLLENENLDSKQKYAAIIWAERCRHTEAARLLTEAGVKMTDASLTDRLFYAAIKGDVPQVRHLLDKGVNVDVKVSIDNSTASIMAAEKGHNEVVTLLLEKGADINTINVFGGTALHGALSGRDPVLAQLLIERGADVTTKHRGTNCTVLMAAAGGGYADVVSSMLEKGVDVNVEDRQGYTALTYAAGEGHTEIVKLLVRAGSRSNVNKSFGRALAVAVGRGHTEIAGLLIEEGASLNEKTKSYGLTTLMVAANKGYTEIVRALIDKGAEVNARALNGLTALRLAENQGHSEIVRLLQDAGAGRD